MMQPINHPFNLIEGQRHQRRQTTSTTFAVTEIQAQADTQSMEPIDQANQILVRRKS